MFNKVLPITAIILAAGQGKRMGQVKQLMPIQGKPMIQHVVDRVISFPFARVVLVTGCAAEQVRSQIVIDPSQVDRVKWVLNRDYEQGQHTSFMAGVSHCPKNHEGVMVFLADQPFIKEETITRLIEEVQHRSDLSCVIQPVFAEQPGHPVYLSRHVFAHMDKLKGDEGAKNLFALMDERILVGVNDSWVTRDIDTLEDYDRLLNG